MAKKNNIYDEVFGKGATPDPEAKAPKTAASQSVYDQVFGGSAEEREAEAHDIYNGIIARSDAYQYALAKRDIATAKGKAEEMLNESPIFNKPYPTSEDVQRGQLQGFLNQRAEVARNQGAKRYLDSTIGQWGAERVSSVVGDLTTADAERMRSSAAQLSQLKAENGELPKVDATKITRPVVTPQLPQSVTEAKIQIDNGKVAGEGKVSFAGLADRSKEEASKIVADYIEENPHMAENVEVLENYVANSIYAPVYSWHVKNDEKFYADAFKAATGMEYADYLRQRVPEVKRLIVELRDEAGDVASQEAKNRAINDLMAGGQDLRIPAFEGWIGETIAEKPYDDMLEQIEAWEKNNFTSSFSNTFDLASLLSGGLFDFINEAHLNNILARASRGEKLYGNDARLYELYKIQQDMESVRKYIYEPQGLWSHIGEGVGTTVNMLPEFAVSMYLTGGVGSFAKMGTMTELKAALKVGGKDLMKYGARALRNVGLAKGRGLISAPFMPMTYNTYFEALNSGYKFNEDGTLVYTPVDKTQAYFGSMFSTANEISSEYLGIGIGSVVSWGGTKLGKMIAKTRVGGIVASGVRKGRKYIPKLSPQAKVAMRTFGVQADPVSETLSEALGDIMTSYEQSMIGMEVDMGQYGTFDYWMTLAGVTLVYGGAMATLGSAKSYNDVKNAIKERDAILGKISNRNLYNTLLAVSTSDDVVLASAALEDFDWAGNGIKPEDEDRRLADAYVVADLNVKVMQGMVEEETRLGQFSAALESMRGIVYQESAGEPSDKIYEAEMDGKPVYVINGLEEGNTTGLVVVVDPATGERITVDKSKITPTRQYTVDEYIREMYSKAFSLKEETKRVEDIKAKAMEMESPTEVDVQRVASTLNISLPKVGDAVMLANGNMGAVTERLSPTEYAVQDMTGATYKVHFTDILSTDKLTATAQGALARGEVSTPMTSVPQENAVTEATVDENGITMGSEVTVDGRVGKVRARTENGDYVVSFEDENGNYENAEVEVYTPTEMASLMGVAPMPSATTESTTEGTPTTTEVATTEDGRVDIEQMSAEDAAKVLVERAGTIEEAIAQVKQVIETVTEERKKMAKAEKKASLNDVGKKSAELQALDTRLEFYGEVLGVLEGMLAEQQKQTMKEAKNIAEEAGVATTTTEETTNEGDEESAETPTSGLIRNGAEMKFTDNVIRMVDFIAQRLGVTIEFVDDLKNEAGQPINGDIKGKHVRISTKGDRGVKFIVGHEFFHRIKDNVDEATYNKYIGALKEFFGEELWETALIAQKRKYRAHNVAVAKKSMEGMTPEEVAAIAEQLGVNIEGLSAEDAKDAVARAAMRKAEQGDKVARALFPTMLTYSDELMLEETAADISGEMVANLDAFSNFVEDNKSEYAIIRGMHKALRYIHDMFATFGQTTRQRKVKRLVKNLEDIMAEAVKNERKGAKKAREDAKKKANTPVDNKVETTEKGDIEAVTNEKTGQGKFSLSTYREGGRGALADFLDARVAENALTPKEAADMMQQMDDIYETCMTMADKYEPFGQWSEAKVVEDEDGNPVLSVIKANGDYAMNLDFSLVCKKRRTLDAVLNKMVRNGMLKSVSQKDTTIAKINEVIRKYGFETACALCFVDARRFQVVKTARQFCDLYNDMVDLLIPKKSNIAVNEFNFANRENVTVAENSLETMSDDALNIEAVRKIGYKVEGKKKDGSDKYGMSVMAKIARHLVEHPEDRKHLSPSDFVSTAGFDNVKAQKPAILSLYNAKKGTGGPKAAFSDVQYLNDIIKSNWKVDEAYAVGGVRLQSFSDYVPRMVFDYIQMVAELAAKKLPVHAYTKEALFAKTFGLTGMKINLSLVPDVVEGGVAAGLDAEGNYAWKQGETFPYDEAIALQNAEGYRNNCGTIAVGVSDAHILKMLDDDNIRMVIPYHKSGLPKQVAKMNNVAAFTDYTNVQNTTKDGKAITKEEAKEVPNYNELLREHKDARKAAQAYVDWCTERGYTPKFAKFATHPNYYKLLEDFTTMVDGKYAPQEAVTFTFPTEESAFGSLESLIEQGLEADAVLEGQRDAKVDAIVEEVGEVLGVQPKFSLPVVQGVYDALKEYEATSDIETFVNKVRDVNDNIALGHPYLTNAILDYYEDGEDEFVRQVRMIVGDYDGGGYAPYTAGGVKFSLATDVASILEEYDTEGVKYGSILDVADGIESLIAESTEDTTELENILNDFRYAQDDARRWGNRMDSGGEEEFEEALRAYASQSEATEEADYRYSLRETDPVVLEQLNNGKTIKVYRAMQVIDGKLYPPMSARVGGKLRAPIALGEWERAEERPDLADDKGYFKLDKGNSTSLKARYNPYIHTSLTPLNDQFSSAQDRPNLVTVEVEIPESELTSGYKAEKAKDTVGKLEWKAGVVQSQLTGTRTVILSRWDRPIRIVPDSEVAQRIVEMFGDTKVVMPSNVVTPSLRTELEKLGVPFKETTNQGKQIEGLGDVKVSQKGNSVFGPVYEGFTGRPKEAARFLSKKENGEAKGVFYLPDYGEISLVWGNNGGGLYHINKKHIIEGRSFKSLDEAVETIDNAVKRGKIIFENGDKIVLEEGDNLVTIRRNYRERGKKIADKNWVLSAYDTTAGDDTSAISGINKGQAAQTPAEIEGKDTISSAKNQTNVGKFSLITPEMDASYLDAVERGDMATAQKMVMEAAKLAMPNTKVVDEDGNPKVVYHGTPNEFTVFGEDISSKHPWTYEGTYYFTDNEANAKTYGGRSVGAFLNITNPYEYDFEGRAWKNLEIGIAVRYARDFSILASGFKTKEEAEAWRENYIKENPDSPLVKDADHIIVDETAILGQAGPTTDEQTQIAKEGGYDGNIQYNIVDVGHTEMYEEDGVFRARVDEEALKPRTNYIAFEPSQIKSADPVTYDDNGNVIPLSERFNPENKDIRYSISSKEDILFEKKTAFLTDLVREYNISLPTFIAQTKEEFRRMALEYGIPEKDIDEDEGKGCYCEDDNIILINGGLMSKPSEMNGTLLHEHGHYITISYLSDRVEELANRLNPEDIEVTRQEVYGKGYSDKNASEIINELVSFMVGRLQKEEAIAIFEGQISIQEFIDKWIQDINGNARSESAKATLYEILPLVKDNIELQKKQYGAERASTIVIPRREYVQADGRGYTKTTLYGGQEHRSIEAQPRDATPDRRGEGADAQEVTRFMLPDPDPSEVFYDDIPIFDEQGNEIDFNALNPEEAKAILDSKVRQMLEAEYEHNISAIRKEASEARQAIIDRYNEEKGKRKKNNKPSRTNAARIDDILGDKPFESLPLEDQALILIATGRAKIRWGDNGTQRGLASELGLTGSKGDKHAYRSIWSGATKSFSEVVHDWWESIGGQERGIDDQDLRNALIEAFQSVQSSKDAMGEIMSKYDDLSAERDAALAEVDRMEEKDLREAKAAYEQHSANFELSEGEERTSYHDRAAQFFANQNLSRTDEILEDLVSEMERQKRKIERLKAENKDVYAPLAEGIQKSKDIILHALERLRMFAGMETVDLNDVARLINLVKAARSQRQVENLSKQATALVQRVSIKKAKENLNRLLSLKLSNTDIIQQMLKTTNAWTDKERESVLKHLWKVSRNGLRVSKAVHPDTKNIFEVLNDLVKQYKKADDAKRKEIIEEMEDRLNPNAATIDMESKYQDYADANKRVAYHLFKAYLEMLDSEIAYKAASSEVSKVRESNAGKSAFAAVVEDKHVKGEEFLQKLLLFNQELENLIVKGKDDINAFYTNREEHAKEIRRMGIDAIGGKRARLLPDVNPKGKSKVSKALKRANAVKNATVNAPYWTLDTVLDKIDKAGKDGVFYKYFMDKFTDSNDAFIQRQRDHAMRLAEAMREFFPKIARFKSAYSLFTTIMHKADSTMLGEVRYLNDDRKIETIRPTISSAMYILAMWRQPRYKAGMEARGITQETIDSLYRQIKDVEEGYIKFMDWINDTFLPDTRLEYDVVHRALYGGSMAKEVNYFPANVLHYEEVKLDDNTGLGNISLSPSALKERTTSIAMPNLTMNYFKVLQAHLQNMDQWASFEELRIDLSTLLSSKEFKNRLMEMQPGMKADGSGAGGLFENLFTTSKIATGLYQTDYNTLLKAISYPQKKWVAANIAYRFWTGLKQLSSIPIFAFYQSTDPMSYAFFGKALARGLNPFHAVNRAMNLSPSLRYRWESRFAGLDVLMRATSQEKGVAVYRGLGRKTLGVIEEFVDVITRFGMGANAAMDVMACAVGVNMIYDYEIYKATKGKREATEVEKRDAIRKAEYAFNSTQQSSEGAYMSAMQMEPALSIYTAYKNASMAAHRKRSSGLEELWRLTTSKEHREFLRGELGEDGVSKRVDTAVSDIMQGFISDVGFAFMGTAGGILMFSLLFGWDDDDWDEYWQSFVKDAALSMLNGYAFGGLAGEAFGSGKVTFNPALDELRQSVASILDGKGDTKMEVADLFFQFNLGVDLKTFYNIAAGLENIFEEEDGNFSGAFLKVLNAPQGYLKAFVGDRREGESLMEYQTRIVRLNTIFDEVKYEDYFDEKGTYVGEGISPIAMSLKQIQELRKEYENAYRKDVLHHYGGKEAYASYMDTEKKYKLLCALLGWEAETKPSKEKSRLSDMHRELASEQKQVAKKAEKRKNWIGGEEEYYDKLVDEQKAKDELINQYYEYIKQSRSWAH